MSEFPHKAEDQVNTFGIVMIGVVSAVLLWVSIVALQAYYQSTAGPLEAAREAEGKAAELRALTAQQRAALQQTEYADAAEGSLRRLPIDLAMKAVVRDSLAGAPSLVPAVGPHDTPTVAPVFGKPVEGEAAGPAGDAEGAEGALDVPEGGTEPEATTEAEAGPEEVPDRGDGAAEGEAAAPTEPAED